MKSYFFRARLMLNDSELHVGSGESDIQADLTLVRDAQSRPYIPGTSLAGVLRHLAARLFPGDDGTNHLFGAPLHRQDGNDASASRLYVKDCLPHEASPPTDSMTRVSIDPARGAASRGKLFSTETVSTGATFDFYLRFDARGEENESEAALGVLRGLLETVCRDGLQVGGQTGVGRGDLRLEGELQIREFCWTSSAHLAQLACCDDVRPMPGDPKELPDLPEPPTEQSENGFSRSFELLLIPIEPMLVGTDYELEPGAYCQTPEEVLNAELEVAGVLNGNRWHDDREDAAGKGTASSARIIVFTDKGWLRKKRADDPDGTGTPCLPGSTVRGCFRARARQILNSLGDGPAANGGEPALLKKLFGTTEEAGRVRFMDFWPECAPGFEKRLKLQDFVAVDRWTGGAADQLKFDARPVYPVVGDALDPDPAADPCRLRGQVRFLGAPEWAEGLFYLLLRDTDEGLVRFGAKRSIGWGRVRVFLREIGQARWVGWRTYYGQNTKDCDSALNDFVDQFDNGGAGNASE